MNELDLSPFKVEFDRDILYTDLRPGDIFYYYLNDSVLKHQLLMCIKHKILADYRLIGIILGGEWAGTDFCEIDDSLGRGIKAIYRINKFKY